MIRKTFLRAGAVLLLGLGACQDETPPVPHEKMEAILADAHLAEVYATQVKPPKGQLAGDRNYDTLAVWYKSLLAHHGLSQKEYIDAMRWYETHPAHLDTVYKRALVRLEKLAADTVKK